jgi:hypothetical protein
MAASLEAKLRLNGGSTAAMAMGGKGGGTTAAAAAGKEASSDGGTSATFPRMGNLRRSFARIRNKVAGGHQPQIVEEGEIGKWEGSNQRNKGI